MWCLQSLGADVYGLELDDEAIAFAEPGLTKVRKGTIDACAGDQPYDLIILNDVVEHPLEPLRLLQGCAKWLRPGGLMQIWTPNGGAARAEEAPITFRVDLEHVQYLTPEVCSMMARDLGLQIAHFETCGFPSLANIDRPRARHNGSSAVRRAARSVPGLAKTVRRLREWASPRPDDRLGSYHLFCVYQKPRA